MHKPLVSFFTALIFLFSTMCPPVFSEVISLDGGSVEVNVLDNTTNWNVTGNPVWNVPDFNIAQGSIYNIAGLGAGASLALLVNGGNASNIFGTMNLSNLDFILQNISGINIGASAMINLSNASLIASTLPLNLSMTDFLKRDYQFSGEGGFLSNAGRITGTNADLVAFVANAMENKGTIEVPMGTVALAAGKTVTVGISPDGLVSIGVDEATANTLGLKDQIKNTGTIEANGGKVILNAKAVDGLFDKAINLTKDGNAVSVIRSNDGRVEFQSIDDIYNDGVVEAINGQIEMEAMESIYNNAILRAMQGEIKLVSEKGAITNTGTIDASEGRIEMSAKGDIETMGSLKAAYFSEKAAAFRIGGEYHVGQSFHDNLDDAITYASNTNVSGTISDIANIVINAGVTLTMTGDTAFNADSDTSGTGAFLMDATATIAGGGHDLTITASEDSTFGKIEGVKAMTLNAHTGETLDYRVGNAVTITGNFTINTGAALTGGFSVTVGGGSVTGNGAINMTGGAFRVLGDGSFGGNTDWTFWELYFGDGTTDGTTSKTGTNKVTALTELKIELNHTLAAGSSTWDLSWGGGYLSDAIQIAAGYEHSLALLSNGTVMAWGYNGSGQLGDGTTENHAAAVRVWSDETMTTYLTGVKEIVAGAYHSMALLADGTVKAWGANGKGQLGDGTTTARLTPVSVFSDATKTALLSGVIQIAAGWQHSLAILSNGTTSTADDTVKAWGFNQYGQLGDGTNSDRTTPVSVFSDATKTDLLAGVIQVAAGMYHSLALLSNGTPSILDDTVKTWGSNENGQLGDGTIIQRTTPVSVWSDETMTSFLTGVKQIVAGQEHNLALLTNGTEDTSDDTVKAWGISLGGQLGDGTDQERWTPVSVYADASLTTYLNGVVRIAAGNGNSFAILGKGTADTSDDTAVGWGIASYGGPFSALGDGLGLLPRSTPVPVFSDATMTGSLTGVTQIVAGSYHSAGLLSNGRVASWGEAAYGKLGNNSITGTSTPVWTMTGVDAFIRLSDISRVVSGGNHTLALKNDGSVLYAWGYNYFGELGDGTLITSLTPLRVRGEGGVGYLTGVLDIAAGYGHSMALLSNGTADTSDDTVMAWGYNESGQLGDGTTMSRLTAVPVYSDATMTSPLTGVTRIRAGYSHSLALVSNGTADTLDDTVKSWGANGAGQLGDGTTDQRLTPVSVYSDETKISFLTGVLDIAAGYSHSLAILSNGTADISDDTVKSWGSNSTGQLGDGTTTGRLTPVSVYSDATKTTYLTGVTQVAAGGLHSLALLSDGTVKAWGSNRRGSLGDGLTHQTIVVGIENVDISSVPVFVSGLTDVTQIAAGMYHSFALLSNGTADTSDDTVKAWGSNGYSLEWYRSGQLGDGSTSDRSTPVSVYSDATKTSYLTGVKQIDAGHYHSTALLSDGSVSTWGYNSHGQLGINSDTLMRTPDDVVVLSHAPFTNNGIVDYQRSTFMYTSAYTFEQVILTSVADEPYYNLVLQYTLDNYVLLTDPSRTAKTPTEQDFYGMIMPGGSLTLLGEQRKLPKIDMAAAEKALKDRDEQARAAKKILEESMGDKAMAFDFFSQFFSPDRAMNFTTDVRVHEGAVYTMDGASTMSFLIQGESLRVPFVETKAELARPGSKEAEAKPVPSVSEPVVVAENNPPESEQEEEAALFGIAKPATPVVMNHDEEAGRYGTLKNPGDDVFVKCVGGEWQAAKDGMVIMPGDVVKTAEAGSVEVMLDGGKVGRVEVREGSLFRISKSETNPATGDKTTLLELAVGKLIAHVEKLQGESKFEVKTPTVLTGVRGTVFEVVVREKSNP